MCELILPVVNTVPIPKSLPLFIFFYLTQKRYDILERLIFESEVWSRLLQKKIISNFFRMFWEKYGIQLYVFLFTKKLICL